MTSAADLRPALVAFAAACSFSPRAADVEVLPDGVGVIDGMPDAVPPDARECGQALFPRDDFDDGVPCSGWSSLVASAANVSETGELLVAFEAAAIGTGGCRTGDAVAVDQDRMFVEVPQGGAGAYTYAELRVTAGSQMARAIHQQGSMIWVKLGEITLVGSYRTYDPAEHRWWQVRHDGALINYETSPDGTTWSPLGTESVTTLDPAIIEIRAGTTMAQTAADEVRFDRMNVCPP